MADVRTIPTTASATCWTTCKRANRSHHEAGAGHALVRPRDRPSLRVVQEGITTEKLAISRPARQRDVARGARRAQARLAANGLLQSFSQRDRAMTRCIRLFNTDGLSHVEEATCRWASFGRPALCISRKAPPLRPDWHTAPCLHMSSP